MSFKEKKAKSKKEEVLTDLQKMKRTRFPLSRIKKIIQQDEDIGKTTITVPVVLSKSCELFIQEILKKAVFNLKEKKTTKINTKNLVEVLKNEKYPFLKDFIKEIEEKINKN